MGLKQKAVGSALWVAFERFSQKGLNAVVFIILARVLEPSDFGLIGMIVIFFTVSQSLVDSGMGQALIRKKVITDLDRSMVFWYNIGFSAMLYVVLFASAPSIASFYDSPQLVSLIRVMGLSLFIFGVTVVQRAELTQQLAFKKMAFAQVPAIIVSGLVSVGMAFSGFGVWSLVTQSLLHTALQSLVLWIQYPRGIRFVWSKSSFDEMFGFGLRLSISSILNSVFNDINKLVIGKFFSADALGFYTQSSKMQDLTTRNFVTIIQRVTYPLLSKADSTTEKLKAGYRQVLLFTSYAVYPMSLTLIILADPIVHLLLGSKWATVATVLQITGISGLAFHIHAINLNVLKVLGRTDLHLKLEVIKKLVLVSSIVIGLQFGFEGLLWAQVGSSMIGLVINTWYTRKLLDYGIEEQLKDIFFVFLHLAPTVLVYSVWVWYSPIETWFGLVSVIALGFLAYLGITIFIKTETTTLARQMFHIAKSGKRKINAQPTP